MHAQANTRRLRNIRRNLCLNLTVQHTLIVHTPDFTAQEQRCRDVSGHATS
ncbi:hypothetical protein KIF59_17445 [Enterobacter cloacae subsp. cloacae]|nr:hypothetical protein [Enterobacter cloacae subsp. cloacae]